MKIEQLQLNNFRNIEKIELNPDKMNVFMGKNAQGKTNILEAIYYLASGSSFRTKEDANLIKFEYQSLFLRAIYNYQDRTINSTLSYDKQNGKIIKINAKKPGQSNANRLKTVLFIPDDLFLVKGTPAKRRKFLDFIIKQISTEYNYNLTKYSNVLKKRNLLLKKEQANGKSYEIVNEIFIESAVKLIIARLNYINILDMTVREIYQKINAEPQYLKIRYALSFPMDSGKINLETLRDTLRKEIAQKSEDEKKRRITLLGPHLDDIHIYQDGRIARQFASQGQQRNISVCLKLAEVESFYKISGYYPVLLLDEVLAELDDEKRQLLINYLLDAPYQCFLTSVSLDKINLSNASIFIIKNGFLLRKE
ncbi:MAG: DNA replication and repair protein RecF [Syntrophomonadaceae bacterium]|nr:DNA replication and repair protein RecF [Syntrophomonadaceae bacterium]MDD3022945.1 DNA replication and repair protein RecF [Syntrophomonadaceae bacterium]